MMQATTFLFYQFFPHFVMSRGHEYRFFTHRLLSLVSLAQLWKWWRFEEYKCLYCKNVFFSHLSWLLKKSYTWSSLLTTNHYVIKMKNTRWDKEKERSYYLFEELTQPLGPLRDSTSTRIQFDSLINDAFHWSQRRRNLQIFRSYRVFHQEKEKNSFLLHDLRLLQRFVQEDERELICYLSLATTKGKIKRLFFSCSWLHCFKTTLFPSLKILRVVSLCAKK